MMIIGLAGKLGTGKTTVANHAIQILENNGIRAIRMSFAGTLKKRCAEIYNFPYDAAFNNKTLSVPIPVSMDKTLVSPSWNGQATVREILQYYGTDVTRKNNPDYWVKAFDAEYQHEYHQAGENDLIVFIDDVRFPNEKKYAEENGLCFRIEAYPGYSCTDAHPSECALDNCDFHKKYFPDYGALDSVGIDVANETMEFYNSLKISQSIKM